MLCFLAPSALLCRPRSWVAQGVSSSLGDLRATPVQEIQFLKVKFKEKGLQLVFHWDPRGGLV